MPKPAQGSQVLSATNRRKLFNSGFTDQSGGGLAVIGRKLLILSVSFRVLARGDFFEAVSTCFRFRTAFEALVIRDLLDKLGHVLTPNAFNDLTRDLLILHGVVQKGSD